MCGIKAQRCQRPPRRPSGQRLLTGLRACLVYYGEQEQNNNNFTMPRIYVGKLSYHVREKDLQRFFSGYGKLLEIDLKNG